MYYFVRSEVPRDLADEFTRKLANRQIRGPEGNQAYVTQDGLVGYDLIDCPDENICRQKYSELVKNGLKILDITPVVPISEFLQSYGGRERTV